LLDSGIIEALLLPSTSRFLDPVSFNGIWKSEVHAMGEGREEIDDRVERSSYLGWARKKELIFSSKPFNPINGVVFTWGSKILRTIVPLFFFLAKSLREFTTGFGIFITR